MPNPRVTAIQNAMSGRSKYKGQPGSPDLPSEEDMQMREKYPTDSGLQDFVNQFGFAAQERPGERAAVPTPRPREPYLDYNNPMGPRIQEVPPGVTMRPGDADRMMEAPSTEEEMDMIQKNLGAVDPDGDEDALAPFTGDVEKDKQLMKQMYQSDDYDPKTMDQFIELHGEENLPKEGNDFND